MKFQSCLVDLKRLLNLNLLGVVDLFICIVVRLDVEGFESGL